MMRAVAVHLPLLAIYLLLRGVQADATNNNNIFLRGVQEEPASGCAANDMAPTNIVGPGNLCADVAYSLYLDGTLIQLWKCGNGKRNQLWTFESDGTIRSNGYCMTVNKPGGTPETSVGADVVIYTCPTDHTFGHAPYRWTLDNATGTITNFETGLVLTANATGTITNFETGHVLTAKSATAATNLSVNVDSKSASQAWTAVNYTQPIMYQITWLGQCLTGNGVNVNVSLAYCDEANQNWALYYDRTIRLYSDRSLCVTANGDKINDNIILSICKGGPNQRWSFKTDRPSTIINPHARLAMTVQNHQNIILSLPIDTWWFIPIPINPKASI